MEFSVTELGYDREEVDVYLARLHEELAQLQVQAQAAAETNAELVLVREEAARLRRLVAGRPSVYRVSGRMQRLLAAAEEEAAEILAQAREELAAAQREAEQLRARAYAEAVEARRDFEAALHARRQREQRADEILRDLNVAIEYEPSRRPG
ncbi:MAG TPA: ATPase [Micromonosporaceae bacterium]